MKLRIPEKLLFSFLREHFTIKETSTGEIRINSPFTQDKKFHCYIDPKQGLFNDFKSGENGRVEKLIAEFLDINENNVLYHLIKEYGAGVPILEKETKQEEEKKQLIIPEGITFFSEKNLSFIGKKALSYLKKRKLSNDVIENLGYIYNENSEFNNSIFIPFYENGELVYFITRDFTGTSKLRYKNPTGFNSKEFVFNYDKLGETILICEGVFDAMSIDSPKATCLLSADLNKIQASKIIEKIPKNIIFVPDNDKTGERTLLNNIQMLKKYKPPSVNFKIYIYRLPNGIKDLNELRVKEGKNNINISECEEYNNKKISELKSSFSNKFVV